MANLFDSLFKVVEEEDKKEYFSWNSHSIGLLLKKCPQFLQYETDKDFLEEFWLLLFKKKWLKGCNPKLTNILESLLLHIGHFTEDEEKR